MLFPFHQILHAGLMALHILPNLAVTVKNSLARNGNILALVCIQEVGHAVNTDAAENAVHNGQIILEVLAELDKSAM